MLPVIAFHRPVGPPGEIEDGDGDGPVSSHDLAYAITAHKAHGNQFPRVVIPIYRSRLLDRTLLYTALTRAQVQVVLVGDRRVYEEAITNPAHPSLRQAAFGTHLERHVKLLKSESSAPF